MDDAIKSAEDNIPSTVTVGPSTVTVDKPAVKDMMEAERRFW
jgi:hypothetical protein